MSLAKIFSIEPLKKQAVQLADGIAKDIPPKIEAKAAGNLSVNRVTTVLERAYSKAIAFQQQQPMGLVKRSIFGNTFRWRLKELGYSEKFAEVATEGLIVKLSQRPHKTQEEK